MDMLAARALRSTRGDILLAALLASVGSTVLVASVPPAGDAPAHLYRTLLVRQGVHVWDNLWYAGQYPLVSYSLLYYFPAALVGNEPLVFVAVVVSAALFAALVVGEWGEAGRWPARIFALLAIGPLFTGTYSYAVGFATMLAALLALQRGRTWLGVVCAALTLGFSPLAFVFLCVVLVAVALGRREVGRRTIGVGIGLAVLAGLQLAALEAFPSEGRYPFRTLELAAVLTACALGAALAVRAARGQVMLAFFAVWALVSVVGFLVPSPFGENLTRLRVFLFPLMLLAAGLARFRPRWLALGACAFAFVYNVIPYAAVAARVEARTSTREFWMPALAFLRRHSSPDFRVEVVPTFDHWEAYWVPRAGYALARGWYRQLDITENGVLYRERLSPAAYRRWLRRMGVRFVLLPDAHLSSQGANLEAVLLRSGRSGLARVFRSADWAIYELRPAVPLLTGAAPAHINELSHERIEGAIAARGAYRLRVNYTRYWKVAAGKVCVARAPDGMTVLRARRGGRFALVLAERPLPLMASALGRRPHC
ncbi:MAG: hypothetical protein M3292_12430 [Actinomycetota bacterium]|nr:hypothetical protein [Actinomycetota bacterium]